MMGVLMGVAIGVLPGLGPTATIGMLLPIAFGMEPVSALIMLSGIFYGAQYGGSTVAILVNLPGEPSSVVIYVGGHQMSLQGRGHSTIRGSDRILLCGERRDTANRNVRSHVVCGGTQVYHGRLFLGGRFRISLRDRSLLLSRGDPKTLLTSLISAFVSLPSFLCLLFCGHRCISNNDSASAHKR
jgi:TctA family transporter